MGTWTYIIKADKPIKDVFELFTDHRNFRFLDHILDVSRWQVKGEMNNKEKKLGGRLLWRVKFGNRFIEYAAEIEPERHKRIVWSDGSQNGGKLVFEKTNADHTKITVVLNYPDADKTGAPEKGGGGEIEWRLPPPP